MIIDFHAHLYGKRFIPEAFFSESAKKWAEKADDRTPEMIMPKLLDGFVDEDGELYLGAVYDPMKDECFSAQRNLGAKLNGKTLQVAQTGDLTSSLLTTGFPYDIRSNPNNNLDQHARFALLSQGVRRLGSAALDLCYVAAGRFDGYWELSLERWDLAAGALIASEAGAMVTAADGDSDLLTQPCSVLAANPTLHAQMLAVLQETQT